MKRDSRLNDCTLSSTSSVNTSKRINVAMSRTLWKIERIFHSVIRFFCFKLRAKHINPIFGVKIKFISYRKKNIYNSILPNNDLKRYYFSCSNKMKWNKNMGIHFNTNIFEVQVLSYTIYTKLVTYGAILMKLYFLYVFCSDYFLIISIINILFLQNLVLKVFWRLFSEMVSLWDIKWALLDSWHFCQFSLVGIYYFISATLIIKSHQIL